MHQQYRTNHENQNYNMQHTYPLPRSLSHIGLTDPTLQTRICNTVVTAAATLSARPIAVCPHHTERVLKTLVDKPKMRFMQQNGDEAERASVNWRRGNEDLSRTQSQVSRLHCARTEPFHRFFRERIKAGENRRFRALCRFKELRSRMPSAASATP